MVAHTIPSLVSVVLLALLGGSFTADALMICPPHPKTGNQLTCGEDCCESFEGPGHGYYCCGANDREHGKVAGTVIHANSPTGRAERFATYTTSFQVDYTLLVIGLIVSIIVSILLSFLCCLLCNGCWLHRRRNPHMYETVNDSGWYPLCCGFGIPLGTVVFSTHPPQFANNPDSSAYYNGSSTSLPSSRNRVRFNEDGTPKGVLKNNG